MCIRDSFDIVLMDFHMPVMDGIDATKAIRAFEASQPNQTRTPIVAVTANIEKSITSSCEEAGMDDYMSKPFTESKLKEMIEKWAGHANTVAKQPEAVDSTKASQNTEESTTFDPKAIEALKKLQRPGQPDVVEKFFTMFLKSSERLMQSLETGLENEDYQAVSVAAHTLKSSSANLGAIDFSAACKQLEADAKSGSPEDIKSLVLSISHQYQGLKTVLMQYKATENEVV